MATQTTSFSIAHYILLICMVVACGGIVAYAIIHDTGTTTDVASIPTEATPVSSAPKPISDECRQNVTNAVAQMWAYNPDVVPVKYQDIAMAYYTGPLNARITGECNGTKFVCQAGMQRMNCDPCAATAARDYAISIHIRDMIQKHCSE